MNTRLIVAVSLFLLLFQAVRGEEEEKTITYKIGGKEYTVTESENPELAKFMEKIEQIAEQTRGGDEQTPEQKPAPEPVATTPAKQPKLGATAESAEALYNKGDFESAYEHYKELSANGDDEASLMLAVMHSKGQGVEADEVAAHAWFSRSAEQGNQSAAEFVDNARLTDAQKEKAQGVYGEISKELDEPDKAESAATTYSKIQRSSSINTQPSTVARTDQSKLTVKTYNRAPAGSYDASPARTYDNAPVKSYGAERFELEKYRTE